MRKLSVFIKVFLRILFTILAVLLAVLATVITCSLNWMFDTWSNLTMDELIYHLTSPLDGTNDAMIREYIDTCIVPAVIVLLSSSCFLPLSGKRSATILSWQGLSSCPYQWALCR